ncbi:MAG: alpha/beta hydrolase fold domain-containing protein [Nitratireductor sp.]
MPRMRFSGPLPMRLQSFLALNKIAMGTYFRHATGNRIAADWGANFEIGIRFVRHQFTRAMAEGDMTRGRMIFDSLVAMTDDQYDVTTEPCRETRGMWFHPDKPRCDTTLLHFHGGGYAFNSAISTRHAAMLAHHTGASVFCPYYRLTPEHAHPAQAEDALAAWHYIATKAPAEQVVISGDSAGGHMALMLLQTLRTQQLPQPALCIGLCPWTDIGQRGDSLVTNNVHDLVQGWMALKFGEWLDPENRFGRQTLSPIEHDFANLAPIYLQAGGREVLHDMILDFANVQRQKGAEIALDVWKDMPHNFQAYDSMTLSSTAALKKIAMAVRQRKLPSPRWS